MYSILPSPTPNLSLPLSEISSYGGYNTVLTTFQLRNRRRTSQVYKGPPESGGLEVLMREEGCSTFGTMINLMQVDVEGPAKEVYTQVRGEWRCV